MTVINLTQFYTRLFQHKWTAIQTISTFAHRFIPRWTNEIYFRLDGQTSDRIYEYVSTQITMSYNRSQIRLQQCVSSLFSCSVCVSMVKNMYSSSRNYSKIFMNKLSVLFERFWNFISIVTRYDYRDYVGTVSNKFDNVRRSYKIFNMGICLLYV